MVSTVINERLEQVEKGFVVDELGGVVLVELLQIAKHVLRDIRYKAFVVPNLIEPRSQVAAVAIAVHLQVQFDVVIGGAETEAADREIGAADEGILQAVMADVVHLAMKEVGLSYGADRDLGSDPIGALAGHAFLFQAVGELQAIGIDQKDLLIRAVGVERVDKAGFAEEEVKMVDGCKMLA